MEKHKITTNLKKNKYNNYFHNNKKNEKLKYYNITNNMVVSNISNNMVVSNISNNCSNNTFSNIINDTPLVKCYLYSDIVNGTPENQANPDNQNANANANTNTNTNTYTNANANTNANTYTYTNAYFNNNNNYDIFCNNCGKNGHTFKNCSEPVVSYGLICFYNKKTILKNNELILNNDFFNKRTKKNDDSILTNSNCNKIFIQKRINNNIPKIRILKRNETLTYTLKNMLGITGINNQSDYNDDLESVIDFEEIIDMDNEYPDNYINNNVDNSVDNTGKDRENIGVKEIITEKVILIQRRNTIGFIEFLRGKYVVSEHDYIVKLFNMMTFDEKRLFREYDNFDVIRTIIGLKRESNYKHEYDDAKKKFNELKNHLDGNLIFKLLDKSYTKWTTPEWGIPKGRRNNKEYDIECAVREFVEETGIKNKHINVYRNVKPLEEIYKGINGVVYKHIYYLANIKENDDARMNIEIIERGGQINHEVSNVRLFSLSECHKIIRPYYISKMNVIKKGFQIINSMNHYFE
jgi:ADP-ribose pyrophosphatase YjhB (NUDIX family)